jgi:hypothetical protein
MKLSLRKYPYVLNIIIDSTHSKYPHQSEYETNIDTYRHDGMERRELYENIKAARYDRLASV